MVCYLVTGRIGPLMVPVFSWHVRKRTEYRQLEAGYKVWLLFQKLFSLKNLGLKLDKDCGALRKPIDTSGMGCYPCRLLRKKNKERWKVRLCTAEERINTHELTAVEDGFDDTGDERVAVELRQFTGQGYVTGQDRLVIRNHICVKNREGERT